ncbi:MAG TPA: SDR family NAD(P)-dependent oxidoreductase [Myxococcota bacterium]|nr:SDR family NAD(P)-dependent oxidoreductase [Myxococcota bacterium]
MNINGNTILITGGGSGIGRGLAQAFLKGGNQVVIAGRRREALDEVTAANPGMKAVVLDIENPKSIRAVASQMASEFPTLNVVINNAGIMRPENLMAASQDLVDAEAMVTTNLLGPIRLTLALLPLLRRQPRSTIMNVSSGLAFLPLAMTPTYCATKAAIHSYTLSLRWQLKETTTEVIELIPPYVATHLMGPQQAEDPRAMPLEDFLAETMQILRTQPTVTEVCVDRVKLLRSAVESGKFDATFQGLNESMPAPH